MQTITVYDGICKDLSTNTVKKSLFAKILEFRIVIQYFCFVTFNWEFFPVDWENNILFSVGNMTNKGYKISQKKKNSLAFIMKSNKVIYLLWV
jgi:hypothetical protein